MCPSTAMSSAVTSSCVAITFLGMISTCTGACGRVSSNATHWSSSYTTFAGISLRAIFRKMLSAIMTSPPDDLGTRAAMAVPYPSVPALTTGAATGGPAMPWLVGIDEAGYGPNLGPFVMSAVCCRAPDAGADLWQLLSAALRKGDAPADGRILVDDSKVVYSSG